MSFPESISWLLTATGALLILAGIVGGGFEVKEVKLPPQSDGFDQIGIASYDADNGLLIRLDMSYQVEDEDDAGLYRLQIERGK